MDNELLSLNTNHVYQTVPIPEGITPITSKPEFHIIAHGFTQKEGVDYQKVFTLVTILDCDWTIFSVVVKHNLELDQMDLSIAYVSKWETGGRIVPSTARR